MLDANLLMAALDVGGSTSNDVGDQRSVTLASGLAGANVGTEQGAIDRVLDIGPRDRVSDLQDVKPARRWT